MSKRYDRNRAARKSDNERRLMGETLSEFHARENPARTAPGAGIPRARCDRTPGLFNGRTDRDDAAGIERDLFDVPKP